MNSNKMIFVFGLIVLFVSLNPALARANCFSLTGNYTCLDNFEDSINLSLNFPTVSSVLLQEGDHEELFAYDQWVLFPDTADLVNRQGWAQCQEGILQTVNVAYDVDSHGRLSGRLRWTNHWQMNGDIMHVLSEGELVPENGTPIPFDGELTCSRLTK